MSRRRGTIKATWAEDRATQRCDPSADPGAETEERAASQAAALTPTFGIGVQAKNLRGTTPRTSRHDVLHNSLTSTGQNSISR